MTNLKPVDAAIEHLQHLRDSLFREEASRDAHAHVVTRMPKRMRKYYISRERKEEVPWQRPADFIGIKLARPIVLVNGCFDILHSGHMKIIFEARKRAGTLVVAMDSDALVARKGPGRPIQTWVERATTMNYMPVDYLVEIGSTKDMTALIETLQPDFRVQGIDYKTHATRYPNVKKCFVRTGAMRTSEIIERCKNVV